MSHEKGYLVSLVHTRHILDSFLIFVADTHFPIWCELDSLRVLDVVLFLYTEDSVT